MSSPRSRSSGALSTAQLATTGLAALTFAQWCTVYSGSTSGLLLATCSTNNSTGSAPPTVALQTPVETTGAGLWVVPNSTAISAVVHYSY